MHRGVAVIEAIEVGQKQLPAGGQPELGGETEDVGWFGLVLRVDRSITSFLQIAPHFQK